MNRWKDILKRQQKLYVPSKQTNLKLQPIDELEFNPEILTENKKREREKELKEKRKEFKLEREEIKKPGQKVLDVEKYDWGKGPSQQTSLEERLQGWMYKYANFWKKLYTGLATHPYTPSNIKRAATMGAIELPKFYAWIDHKQMDATGKKLKKLIRQAMEEKE